MTSAVKERSAAKAGSGYFSDITEVTTLPDQLVVLSGYAHGAVNSDDPNQHVHMIVNMPGESGSEEYVITDLGYNTEAQTVRFSIRKVGGFNVHYVAIQHDEKNDSNSFMAPTTEDALDLIARLIEKGEWNIGL